MSAGAPGPFGRARIALDPLRPGVVTLVARSLRRLVTRFREWWAVEDPEDRIEGSGEVSPDPAYNGRYTAERERERLVDADRDEGDGPNRNG